MLPEILESRLTGRVALVGVGNEARGDDGVGPLIIRLLGEEGLTCLLDSGSSPELDTWRIREWKPDAVLFMDAVDWGGSPGEIAWLTVADLRSDGCDTHRPPLKLTMEYLEQELKCHCFLLAIQPKDLRYGAPLCDEVRESASILAELLRDTLFTREREGEKR